ncbi:Uncharacterized protein dnm_005480 [Desulfonema magnum]|uniref:Uncharacterized protein n=1 Tax=Desulfonema magnum TaxID=45655 RepID=A0A975GKC2_9BACT|nr:Uncharacterized protein dnm_005480 [Desulfonema magnum]
MLPAAFFNLLFTRCSSFFLSFLRKQESTASGSVASAQNGFLLSQE